MDSYSNSISINFLDNTWHDQLQVVTEETVQGDYLKNDFDWISSADLTVESVTAVMSRIWAGMPEDFKQELLTQIFRKWGAKSGAYMVRRPIHYVVSTAKWIFGCLLTKLISRQMNPHGLVVGAWGSNYSVERMGEMDTAIESDALRFFPDLVQESAKTAIDSLYGMGQVNMQGQLKSITRAYSGAFVATGRHKT